MMWLYVSHIHINLILYIHKWMGHPWSWWRRHGHWGGWWNGRPGWWWHPWYGHPYWWWHGNHWRALGPLPSSVLTSTKHCRFEKDYESQTNVKLAMIVIKGKSC